MNWINIILNMFKKKDCSEVQGKLDKCQSSLGKMDGQYRAMEDKLRVYQQNGGVEKGDQAEYHWVTRTTTIPNALLDGKFVERKVPVDITAIAIRSSSWVNKVRRLHDNKLKRYPMDGFYPIPPFEFSIDWLKWDLTDQIKYKIVLPENPDDDTPEQRIIRNSDCDKFARRVWLRCGDTLGKAYRWAWSQFGFVNDFSGGHAYNSLMAIKPEHFYYDVAKERWIDKGETSDGSDGEYFYVEPQNDRVDLWGDHMRGIHDAESGMELL